jgi:hypothetical protein
MVVAAAGVDAGGGVEMNVRRMRNPELGEQVVVRDRVYVVRGFSPMSVRPPRVLLENVASGQRIELPVSELLRGADIAEAPPAA